MKLFRTCANRAYAHSNSARAFVRQNSSCGPAIFDVIRQSNKVKLYTRLIGVPGISSDSLAKVMKLLLLDRDFANVILVCEVLRLNSSTTGGPADLGLTERGLCAAVLAHGYMQEVGKAERLVRSLQLIFPGGVASPNLVLEALLHCYCVNGRVAAAEALLLSWLHVVDLYGRKPSDTSGDRAGTRKKHMGGKRGGTAHSSAVPISDLFDYLTSQTKMDAGDSDSARRVIEDLFAASQPTQSSPPISLQGKRTHTPNPDTADASTHRFVHSVLLQLGDGSSSRGPGASVWRDVILLYISSHMWRQCLMVAEWLRTSQNPLLLDQTMFDGIAGCLIDSLQFEQVGELMQAWPEHSMGVHVTLRLLRTLAEASEGTGVGGVDFSPALITQIHDSVINQLSQDEFTVPGVDGARHYSVGSSELLLGLARFLVATGHAAQAADSVVALHSRMKETAVVVDPRVIGYLIQRLTAEGDADRAIQLYRLLSDGARCSPLAQRHANLSLLKPTWELFFDHIQRDSSQVESESGLQLADRSVVYSNCVADSLKVHAPQSYHSIVSLLLRLHRAEPVPERRVELERRLGDFIVYQTAHNDLDAHTHTATDADTDTNSSSDALPEDVSSEHCRSEAEGGVNKPGGKPKSLRRILLSDPLLSLPLQRPSPVAATADALGVHLDTGASAGRKPPKELDQYTQMLNRRIRRRIALRQTDRASSTARMFQHMYGVNLSLDTDERARLRKDLVGADAGANAMTPASDESALAVSIEHKLESFANYLTSKF